MTVSIQVITIRHETSSKYGRDPGVTEQTILSRTRVVLPLIDKTLSFMDAVTHDDASFWHSQTSRRRADQDELHVFNNLKGMCPLQIIM